MIQKIMIKAGLLLIGLFLQLQVFAQPDVAPIRKVNGKKYYVHTVESGNTLWGISRTYAVSVNDIKAANPGLGDGLQIGQEVLIPKSGVDRDEAENAPSMVPTGLVHTVAKGETLYGIARRYNITMNDLIQANPESASGSISIGQKLNIPTAQVTVEDPNLTTPATLPDDGYGRHTVKAGETLYGIAQLYQTKVDTLIKLNPDARQGLSVGKQIRVPALKVTTTPVITDTPVRDSLTNPLVNVVSERAEVYKVALIMPFYLYKNKQIQQDPDPTKPKDIFKPTLATLDYYSGTLAALDSLKRMGISVELFVYDSEGDSTQMAKTLNKPEMKQMHLIIGPVASTHLGQVMRFGKRHNIHVVAPINQNSGLLRGNLGYSKVTSSLTTQMSYLGQYTAQKYSNENVIMVKSPTRKDDILERYFIKSYNNSIKLQPLRYRDSLYVGTTGSNHIKVLSEKFDRTKLNVLVLPTDDEAFVSHFFTMMGQLREREFKDYRFVIYGLEKWQDFQSFDTHYKQKYGLHITSPYYCDYMRPEVTNFYKFYRMKNRGIDPGVYSMLGFDVTYYYVLGLQRYGTGFFQVFPEMDYQPLVTDFNLGRRKAGEGFENRTVYILKYEDFQLKKVD